MHLHRDSQGNLLSNNVYLVKAERIQADGIQTKVTNRFTGVLLVKGF